MNIHISKKAGIVMLIVMIGIVAGIGIGYAIASRTNVNVAAISAQSTVSATPSSSYPLLDPDVANTNMEHFIINLQPLKTQLTDLQKQYSQPTYIYFEYLNNTATFGLNATSLFTAASTIKVPLAMAIYKMVEEGKLKLTDTYSLQQTDLDSNFGTLYQSGAGSTFTVQQLLTVMLEQSDNTAMNALVSVLQGIGINDPFQDVYSAMGWDYPPNFGTKPTYINIDAKTLSNMFTSLYEATYDNAADSQAILYDLTQSPFNNQIVAGVPAGITVAHKIGVAAETQTYSDCGIVYAPERSYLICAAMAGASQSSTDQFISQVSNLVYQYIIHN
jgi:beta-lactamase class A